MDWSHVSHMRFKKKLNPINRKRKLDLAWREERGRHGRNKATVAQSHCSLPASPP